MTEDLDLIFDEFKSSNSKTLIHLENELSNSCWKSYSGHAKRSDGRILWLSNAFAAGS
jgi:hypothetical protein